MAKAKRWFYIIENGNREQAINKELLVSAYGEFLNQIFLNQDADTKIVLEDDRGNKYFSWISGTLINHDIGGENELEVICGHKGQQF